ncbi:hypothetical protein [Nocardia farcinica]|uniref:hypothetical protein n=1 Tax=Nocardia farcinica TaxID=37329 RepID=UPI00245745AF|nr:hypothetical protein [Nocardia farcinica]
MNASLPTRPHFADTVAALRARDNQAGGVDRRALSRFYAHHFVHSDPADTESIPISRMIGADRIVAEQLFCFTHDREIDWMLSGVAPTGPPGGGASGGDRDRMPNRPTGEGEPIS